MDGYTIEGPRCETKTSTGLSRTALIGMGVGIAAGVLLIALVVILIARRKYGSEKRRLVRGSDESYTDKWLRSNDLPRPHLMGSKGNYIDRWVCMNGLRPHIMGNKIYRYQYLWKI